MFDDTEKMTNREFISNVQKFTAISAVGVSALRRQCGRGGRSCRNCLTGDKG